MSGQPSPPAPPGVARSQLILAAGFATSASILATWLLIWLVFFQTNLRLLAFASDASDGTLPVGLAFQRADARDATAPQHGAGELRPLPAADPRALLDAVRAYLEARRGQTSVVVIAAPALESFAAESSEVVLAPADVLRHVVKDEQLRGAPLRELVGLFQQARGKRLLILDIGRSRSDTDAGAFGDDAMAELARIAQPPDPAHEAETAAWHDAWDGLAILCAAAPGQWTWSSDADGRSVFGHFVAEGLRRGGDVEGLLRAVPAQVAAWVYANRGSAVQTPMVLGDRSLSFTLPTRKDRAVAEPDPRQGDQARRTRDWLMRHYQHHAAYERAGLPGLDPTAWRDYRRAWLAAERLFRAGQIHACQQMLAEADSREASFRVVGDRDWPSLEFAAQVVTDPDRLKPLLAAREALAAPGSEASKADGFAESQPRRFGRVFDEALRAAGGKADPARLTLAEPAARLRILAERAATLAPAGHPWVDLLIDRAGAKRREATDLLHSAAPVGPVAALIAEAEAVYDDAIKLAQAVNLAHRAIADLPSLGAWAVRRGQFDRDRFRDAARKAQALAGTLDANRRDPGEPPVARVKAEADALALELASLRKGFDRAAEAAAQATSWRDIDDVLAVPSIRPELREALVSRSVDPALFVALRPPPQDPKAEAGESAAVQLARQGLGSGINASDLGRQGLNAVLDRSREWDVIGPAPEVRPDPTFAQYQADLAVLEWCLLTAGGLTHKASLEALLKPPSGPGGVARAARAARARLLAQTPAPIGDDPAALALFERARLVLPAPDPEASTADLGDPGAARWARFLVRMADILREDGDGRLAARYLEALPDREREAEPARAVARGVEALARPIVLRGEAQGPTTLAGGPATPVALTVQAPPGTPRGRAALLLGEPDKLRLRSDGPTALLDVGGTAGVARRVEVRRAEALADVASRAALAPVLVFRGRRAEAEPIPFDLPIVRSDFRVRFVTPAVADHRFKMMRAYHIDPRQVVDQFERDPRTYTFYRGAETTLNAVVTYSPAGEGQPSSRRIVASASFDGKPLGVRLKEAKPPSGAEKEPRAPTPAGEIRRGQDLTFEIDPINTSDPKFRTHPDGSEFRFEVRDQQDDPATEAAVASESVIRFQEIDPASHFAVTAQRVSPTEVDVTVRRGVDDPIALVVGAAVQITGGAPALESITYEQNGRLNKDLAERAAGGHRPENRAILPRGEAALFRFSVGPQENLSIRAELINSPGRPPWPLVARPDRLPAAVAPPQPRAPSPDQAAPPNQANPGAVNPPPANPAPPSP